MTMTMTDPRGRLPADPAPDAGLRPAPGTFADLLHGSQTERMARVIDACGWLARNGCQVLAAHVIDGLPRVCAAPPVPLSGALRRRTTTETVRVAIARGVLVEWRAPR